MVCEVSGGFWAWFQRTLRSRNMIWMIYLWMLFGFEGLWWKFFTALEAWIRRVSPICGLLRFLEAFELDSNDLWDLGRWFGYMISLQMFFVFKVEVLEVLGGFKAWFQWPLRSRKMIWMIPLRMFFGFEGEVLKVLGGFRAWFQQSFCTFESWCLLPNSP